MNSTNINGIKTGPCTSVNIYSNMRDTLKEDDEREW